MPYGDFEVVIMLSNDIELGLSAGIFTDDHTEINRYVDEVDFGVIKDNEKTTGLELHMPFGGMNTFSLETYQEQSDAALDFYSITNTIYDNY